MGTTPLSHDLSAAERGWVVEHDERRSFVWPYLAISVFCSVFVSLFWLLVLVAVHLGIEVERAKRLRLRPTLGWALWEIKLDLGLLLLALSMAVYMDVAFGILGLGASARAGAAVARAGARANVLRRVVRGVLLVLDDIVRVVGAIVAARGIQEAPAPSLSGPPWRETWTWGDRIAIALLVAVGLLLAASPWLSGHDLPAILRLVLSELHPWPANLEGAGTSY